MAREKFREGERVRDSAGNRGTVHTDEAGGFVRVRFDKYADDPMMTDTLVDVEKLRRIK